MLYASRENEQECIPVGCVPAARRPYARVCFPGGGPGPGGVPGPGGSAPGRGWGVGGLVRGVCSWGGGIPACTEAEPPPSREQNDKQV